MDLIAASNLILRKDQKLPTLIIDIRGEWEALNFRMIDDMVQCKLDEFTFGGARIPPHQIKEYKVSLYNWSEINPNAIVVVGSTKFFKHCERVNYAYNELIKYGMRAKVLNPHLYDLHNLLLGKRLNKVLIKE